MGEGRRMCDEIYRGPGEWRSDQEERITRGKWDAVKSHILRSSTRSRQVKDRGWSQRARVVTR